MALVKKCKHATGLTGEKRLTAWKRCGCEWLADVTVNGKRRYTQLGADYRAARRRHLEMVAARDAGETVSHQPASELSVQAVAERWWIVKEPRIAPNTRSSYQGSMRLVCEALRDGDVRKVTPLTIQEMESSLLRGGYAPGTVAHARGLLNQILGHAKAEGLIREVPKAQDPVKRRDARPEVMQPEDVDAALAQLDGPWRAITELTYLTGLRAGEALGLEGGDIRDGVLTVQRQIVQRTGEVALPKMGKVRDVDLTPNALALIPAGSGRLFPFSYYPWLNRWHDALALAGLEKRGLHTLRHSNIAIRVAIPQSLEYVARQVGHSTAAYTLRKYGGWIPGDRDDPAGIDAFRHGASRRGGR